MDNDELALRNIFIQLRRGERCFDDSATASLLIRLIERTGHSVNSLFDFMSSEEKHLDDCLCWECIKNNLEKNHNGLVNQNFSV